VNKRIGRRDFLKIAGFGLAGATLFGTTGCGGGGQGGSGPIRIGALLSFSGPFAPIAESIQNGMDLYFEQNENMIGDQQVEVLYEDDEGDPQAAIRKYRQLLDRDQANVLVGPISSSVALALVEPVTRDEAILIDANAAANDLSWSQKSDYIYRVSFSNWQTGHAPAAYISENVGKTAFALAPDYPAGQEVIAAFKAAFEEAGGSVVGESYPQLGANDYATYLTEATQAGPELVFAFFAGADAIRFVQQYQEFGLKDQIPLTGGQEFGDLLVTQPAGEDAEGIISAVPYSPFDMSRETNRSYVEDYQAKYEKLPDLFSVNGYDSAQVITQAVQEAGSTEPGDLIEVLKGISFESPRGPVTLDPNTNNPIQNYYVVRNILEDGEITLENLTTVEAVAIPESPPS
jgi:branched-chain amino acid transport system substrate-binding protein